MTSAKLNLKTVAFTGALLIIAIFGLMLASRDARGAQVVPVEVQQTGSVTTLETIACNSGASPCTIGASATTVLNAALRSRHECLIQNTGVTVFYCLKGAGTPTATGPYHFVLKAASGAHGADGGFYSCNSAPIVYGGLISCISSAGGGTLAVSAD